MYGLIRVIFSVGVGPANDILSPHSSHINKKFDTQLDYSFIL